LKERNLTLAELEEAPDKTIARDSSQHEPPETHCYHAGWHKNGKMR
jgi:hypothetical protein